MRIKFLILLLLGVIGYGSIFAEEVQPQAKEKLLNSLQNTNSSGRQFLIAFPPNDRFNTAYKMLDIYVTSSVNTTVTLKNVATGLALTKQVRAYDITIYSIQTGDVSQEMESHPSRAGQVEDKGYYLESPDPIAVYVLSDKEVSADGYLAIPTSQWGTRYMHISFWDFKEVFEWGSGFIVLANEDNTKVNITLRGRGAGVARTAGSGPGSNKTIGNSFSVTLRKGQTINIMGDGKTRGLFDMTGSLITANKKIGLISYHERTMIPVTVITNGRDNLIEMIPPIQAWGKEYHTSEYQRGQDMGDFYRAMASEDNTNVKLFWYDKKTRNIIGKNETTLNAGEYLEALDIQGEWPGNRNNPGVRGLVSFYFDKPGFVMQYCYSANWDLGGGSVYDPFMINVVPVEQFTKNTVFLTPKNNSGNDFKENFLNIIAVGDSSDFAKSKKMLESILLDGTKLTVQDPKFLLNRIPNTNLYSADVRLGAGVHRIFGDTPFGGYIYGYATFESYGWPAATAVRVVGKLDTLPPVPKPVGECGVYTIPTTEKRNADPNDPNPVKQEDVGVSGMPILLPNSYNFSDPVLLDKELEQGDKEFSYKIEIKDKYKDALAVIQSVDDNGNDTIIYIRYEVDSVKVNPDPIKFVLQRINTTSAPLKVKVESHSDSVIYIKEIKLKKGEVFAVSKNLDKGASGFIELQPREVKEIELTYRPTQEWTKIKDKRDVDSLIIETKCITWLYPVFGKGGIPIMEVDDYNAGRLSVGSGDNCIEIQRGTSGIGIRNIGTDTLIITGTDKNNTDVLPFKADNFEASSTRYPIIILPLDSAERPAKEYFFTKVCVNSANTGTFSRDVDFVTNGARGDSVSNWSAIYTEPGPAISSEIWPPSRLNSVNTTNGTLRQGTVVVTNKGTEAIDVIAVRLDLSNPNVSEFKILDSTMFKNGLPVKVDRESDPSPNARKQIVIPVQYNPTKLGNASINITAWVVDPVVQGNYILVNGTLSGVGYVPEISVSSYTFTPSTRINNKHQTNGTDTEGFIEISNTSLIQGTGSNTISPDLEIFGISQDNGFGNPTDFSEVVVNGRPWSSVNNNNSLKIPFGEKATLKMHFTPSAIGDRKMRFNVLSDAGPQKSDNTAPKDVLNQDGQVWGKGFTLGTGATNIDYENVLTCETPTLRTIVSNSSSTQSITIKSIEPIAGSNPIAVNSFERITDLQNQVIDKDGGTLPIEYRFKSSGFEGPLQATYIIEFVEANVPSATFTISANPYTLRYTLDLLDNSKNDVGKEFNMAVTLKESKSIPNINFWDNAKITDLKFTLVFEKTTLRVLDGNELVHTPGSALKNPGSWSITHKIVPNPKLEDKDSVRVQFEISSKDGSYIDASNLPNATLIVVKALQTISKYDDYNVRIDLPIINNNDRCVFGESLPGNYKSPVCAQIIRGDVFASNYNYALKSINPNPVSTNTFDLNFELAFDGHTEIDIISSAGNIISVPVSQTLKAGTYKVVLPTSNIGSGSYFVRLKSSFYEETIPLLISK